MIAVLFSVAFWPLLCCSWTSFTIQHAMMWLFGSSGLWPLLTLCQVGPAYLCPWLECSLRHCGRQRPGVKRSTRGKEKLIRNLGCCFTHAFRQLLPPSLRPSSPPSTLTTWMGVEETESFTHLLKTDWVSCLPLYWMNHNDKGCYALCSHLHLSLRSYL